MNKAILTFQLIWILAVVSLAHCTNPGDTCEPGEGRCTDEAWDIWETCNDDGTWGAVPLQGDVCIDSEPHYICDVTCDEGIDKVVGGIVWTCLNGPRCSRPYMQRRTK